MSGIRISILLFQNMYLTNLTHHSSLFTHHFSSLWYPLKTHFFSPPALDTANDFFAIFLPSIKNKYLPILCYFLLDKQPIDKVIVIKKWNFEMEVKVFDEDYPDYWDMVADYEDIIYNPEIKVLMPNETVE